MDTYSPHNGQYDVAIRYIFEQAENFVHTKDTKVFHRYYTDFLRDFKDGLVNHVYPGLYQDKENKLNPVTGSELVKMREKYGVNFREKCYDRIIVLIFKHLNSNFLYDHRYQLLELEQYLKNDSKMEYVYYASVDRDTNGEYVSRLYEVGELEARGQTAEDALYRMKENVSAFLLERKRSGLTIQQPSPRRSEGEFAVEAILS